MPVSARAPEVRAEFCWIACAATATARTMPRASVIEAAILRRSRIASSRPNGHSIMPAECMQRRHSERECLHSADPLNGPVHSLAEPRGSPRVAVRRTGRPHRQMRRVHGHHRGADGLGLLQRGHMPGDTQRRGVGQAGCASWRRVGAAEYLRAATGSYALEDVAPVVAEERPNQRSPRCLRPHPMGRTPRPGA